MVLASKHMNIHVPYSGFLSREKTSANCLKIEFCRENYHEFAVTQCTTPTNAVSNCFKIDFRGKNFPNHHRNANFTKVFSRERNTQGLTNMDLQTRTKRVLTIRGEAIMPA